MIEVSVMTGVGGHSGVIPVDWGRFPCGERNVKVGVIKGIPESMLFEQVSIHLHYQSDSDLIDLLLLVDAIKRSEMNYKNLVLLIGYFPYSRQDRVCNHGEPHSLKVVCNLINSCGFDRVYVVDPHSDVIEGLLDKPEIISIDYLINSSEQAEFGEVDAYVSPDGGAYKKVTKAASIYGKKIIRADKIRDTMTGQLSGFEVYASDLTGMSVMIVDDICDGGGTFIGLAQKLRERGAKKVLLYVSHGMFTKGVDILKEHIDEILCYEYHGSPEDKDKVIEVELYNGR